VHGIQSQIRVLARQTGIDGLEKAYKQAIKQRFGYLVVNLQPQNPDIITLQMDIFAQYRKIYVEK